MMLKRLVTLVFVLVLAACSKEEAKKSDVELKEVDFSVLQGFEVDDFSLARTALLRSCEAVAKGKGEFLGHSAIKINRQDYLLACAKARQTPPAQFKEFVKNNFTPYQVTYKGSSEGKFTSYYEAEINASYTKDDVYKYPVYGIPNDLIEVNLKDFDASLPAKKIIGRKQGNKLIPYYTRAEINKHGLKAPVILWADCAVDVFVMQIQGSAVAKLPDGSKVRIAFASSNGRPFKGIGSILLEKGLLQAGQANMGSIKKWLKANPDKAFANMDENDRYIFHRLGNPEGPVGAQGVPLTAGRSLAVDKDYVPLGALLWLETTLPGNKPLKKLMVAQDIGSAIKGAVRGDYFWGSGGDDVLSLAGSMNSKGTYYILLPQHEGK